MNRSVLVIVSVTFGLAEYEHIKRPDRPNRSVSVIVFETVTMAYYECPREVSETIKLYE